MKPIPLVFLLATTVLSIPTCPPNTRDTKIMCKDDDYCDLVDGRNVKCYKTKGQLVEDRNIIGRCCDFKELDVDKLIYIERGDWTQWGHYWLV